MGMISTVILHLGGLFTSLRIQTFCAKNSIRLAKQGFLYPEGLDYSPLEHSFSHSRLAQFLVPPHPGAKDFRPLSMEILHRVEREAEGTGQTLCFSITAGSFYLTDAGTSADFGAKLFHFFQKRYPGARIRAFYSAVRQGEEYWGLINPLCVLLPVSNSNLRSRLQEEPRLFSYDILYDTLCDHLAPQDIHISLSPEPCRASERALDEFVNFAGLENTAELDYSAPLHEWVIPRDTLDFIDLVKRIYYVNRGEEGASPPLFLPELFSAGKEKCLFWSPEEQSRYLAKHGPGNARLARRLGLPLPLFADPAPDPDWEPCKGITEESAWRHGLRLPQENLLQIINEIDSMPPEHKWNEVYILQEGLQAVNAGKGAVPLSHRREAEVTVLTPSYNHVKFIEQNIIGVLEQQTDFPVEHIICDDGSTDGTQDVIMQYARKYPHIKPLFRKNKNSMAEGYAMVRLFEMAHTKYVSLCDGDDYFCDPQKLQRQYYFLEQNKRYAICFHPVRIVWENRQQEDRNFPRGREIPPHGQPFTLTDLVRWNFMSTSSVMYRWRFADGVPYWFNPEALPGDWYWHLLHAELGRIGMLPQTMSVYRRHNSGLWADAETDRIRHKKRYGMKELSTYIAMDAHLKGRFRNLFSEHIFWEFSMLYELSMKHGTPEPLRQAIAKYPEWAKRVSDMAQSDSAGGEK